MRSFTKKSVIFLLIIATLLSTLSLMSGCFNSKKDKNDNDSPQINEPEEDRLAYLLEKMNEGENEKYIEEYSALLDRFTNAGGFYFEKEYEAAIKQFGFSESDKYKPLSDFSGGQRTKIAFLKLLLSKPDLLLLDEPTNHLDIEAVEWLESYLSSYKKAVVIVSHDRMFLDKIVDVVYEIEYGVTKR